MPRGASLAARVRWHVAHAEHCACRPMPPSVVAELERSQAPVAVECVIPILRVRDLKASLRFYMDVLGFAPDWGHEDGSAMASVSRNGRAIMLCQGEQGNPGTWVWIGVEDVAPLFRDLRARGARIRQPPTDYPWAREMRVEDPDGHVLRFGSEPIAHPEVRS